jgi:hypothetical protein
MFFRNELPVQRAARAMSPEGGTLPTAGFCLQSRDSCGAGVIAIDLPARCLWRPTAIWASHHGQANVSDPSCLSQ